MSPERLQVNSFHRSYILTQYCSRHLRHVCTYFIPFLTKFLILIFFQGSQYSVASDLWSLGLSLLEISFGMYPIPPPDTSTQVQLFGPQVLEDNLISPHPKTPRTPRSPGTKPMAIFELLEYIVNQPAPKLPKRIFSDNMRDFVERCLKKNPTERPDLSSLMVSIDI